MTMTDWFVRVAFVSTILIGSRCFLCFDVTGSGIVEILTSFSMMMVSILAVESLIPGVVGKIILSFLCVSFILFHLINGVYYRFFNCMMPPDVFRQWADLFVVHNEGTGLISITEFVTGLILPLTFLVLLLLRPAQAERTAFLALLITIGIGWWHRLSEHVVRRVNKVAALPSFIHRAVYLSLKAHFGKKRYYNIIQNIDTTIPRYIDGYKIVPGKGLMVEPVHSASHSHSKKYNVIVILLESVRAFECGFLGSQPSFTPCLDKLTKQGIVYDNFYANGSLTVRGEFSTLCSLYPNPFGVPTYLVNPAIRVTSLPEILSKAGYDTLWFSAYTADFHNKRAFLSKHGIKKIIDRDVLPAPKERIVGWGMNDEEMFGYVWQIIKDSEEPFFAQITTLSNHHVRRRQFPTDKQAPMIDDSSKYQSYVHGVYYTDYAVSRFINNLLHSELSTNTVLIVTGDHGLWIFPKNISDPLQKREIYFRSPLCIWGPTDIITPGVDHTLGSQVDLAPTVLDMLNIRQTNTFVGQSLVNNSISQEQRYVATYLGSEPSIRVGSIFMVPNEKFQKQQLDAREVLYANPQKKSTPQKGVHKFALLEGDALRGNYTIKTLLDNATAATFSQRIDDLTFLIGHGIYFDAFMGVPK